jgi:dTDP-4-dehydrorhamnose reductase
MRILLIGSTGQLGGDVLRNNHEHDIIAPGRDQLDLARPDQVEMQVRDVGPDLVINCAAFHNVPLCEEKPDQAFLVNCIAVGKLAAICRKTNARLVTFSSDYVFGGDQRTPYIESDPPRPLQIYGISRAAGEFAALSAAPQHAYIVRTCGLYGRSGARSKGGNFVDNRVADGMSGKALEMASEQIVCPTATDDLSRAVLELIVHPGAEPGIYHLVNEGECSWYELTRAIYEILDLKAELRPVDRKGVSGNMRRPLYSVLANSKARALGISMRPWRDALDRYLAARYPAASTA